MTEPRWLDETEMRAWAGFLETSNLLAKLVETQLRDVGSVTQVQYEILTRLHESAGLRSRMTELAHAMVCSRSGLTYQVAQMEKAGLLRRETDPDDERGVFAVLTPDGLEVLARTAPGHVGVVREGFLDALTPRDLAQLAAIMDRTRAHLKSLVDVQPPRRVPHD
ncbi:MarR family winged helix-turn-helix transcriptional regulator [Streptomyces sp. NPDC058701]|uniref:MarR family winged helix-turn-helix transcriptional regulator n=1 Tax=Streptomyces sp. NPDC058701 TaxID=3346608 RepID=UPI003655B68D